MANRAKFMERIHELLEKITYRQWGAIAAVVSCLLGLMVYFAISGSDDNRAEKNPSNLVQVVAAKQDIPERTIVTADMLKVVEVPSDLVPDGAYHDVSEAADHPASTAIQQGDIVTSRKVYKDIRMAGFTGVIPADCRAVTIPITDVTGVAGFAHPGDYVDIMVITGTKENGMEGSIILQNVLLLGINKSADLPSGDSSGSIKASADAMATATVALKPSEALKLAVASQEGTLYLDLRPFKPRDMYTFDTDYAGTPQGNGTAAVSQPEPQPASSPAYNYTPPATQNSAPASAAPAASSAADYAPPVLGKTIEVIRGVTSTKEAVK